MPYDWIEPAVFMEHRGWTVYHIYRNDQFQDGPRDTWYTFSMCSCDGDGHGSDGCFDIYELPAVQALRSADPETYKQVIRNAMDVGYFDTWDWPDKQPLRPKMGST